MSTVGGWRKKLVLAREHLQIVDSELVEPGLLVVGLGGPVPVFARAHALAPHKVRVGVGEHLKDYPF